MQKLTINRHSWLDYREVLDAREPFTTSGNLSGVTGATGTGRMPEPFASLYRERAAHVTYTVLSYATPVAWHDDEQGWIVPPVTYSVTTSKAMSRIAPAIAAING